MSPPIPETSTEVSTAWPLAGPGLRQELLDLVQQASHNRQMEEGLNEGEDNSAIVLLCTVGTLLTFQTLLRGTADATVLAGDT